MPPLLQKYPAANPSTSMNMLQYDLNTLFTEVIADPASNPITANIKNTTGWCPAYYDDGKPHSANFTDPSCGNVPLGEFVWINSIHPTITMYDAIADGIASMFGYNGDAS